MTSYSGRYVIKSDELPSGENSSTHNGYEQLTPRLALAGNDLPGAMKLVLELAL